MACPLLCLFAALKQKLKDIVMTRLKFLMLPVLLVLGYANLTAQPAALSPNALSLRTAIGGETITGDWVTLDSLGRRYVIVEIWAPWSPACKRSAGMALRLYKWMRKQKKSVRLLKYAVDSDKERWEHYVKSIKRRRRTIIHVRDSLGHASPIFTQIQPSKLPYLLIFSPRKQLLYAGTDEDAAQQSLRDAIRKKRRR